MGSNIKSF